MDIDFVYICWAFSRCPLWCPIAVVPTGIHKPTTLGTSAFMKEMTFATFVLNILSSLPFTWESVSKEKQFRKEFTEGVSI